MEYCAQPPEIQVCVEESRNPDFSVLPSNAGVLPALDTAKQDGSHQIWNMRSQNRDKMGLENSAANGPCCRKLPLGPGAANICHGGGDYRPGRTGWGTFNHISGMASSSARTPVWFLGSEEQACSPAISGWPGALSVDPKKRKQQRSKRHLIF